MAIFDFYILFIYIYLINLNSQSDLSYLKEFTK